MTARSTRSKHPLCRPPVEAFEVLRLFRGKWAPDNGKPGQAFSYQDARGFPMAGSVECDCGIFGASSCPSRNAMNKTSERWGCANGRNLKAVRR